MGLNPWYTGDTYEPFNPTLLLDNGTAPNFSGASASITFTNTSTGASWQGLGIFTLNGASFSYAWTNQDVATAGKYKITIKVIFASGGQQTWDDIPWEVRTS